MASADAPHFPLPRPIAHRTCFKCKTESLGELICGQGGGKILGNWGRWMQRCNNCSAFAFHGPLTPEEYIPLGIRDKFQARSNSATTVHSDANTLDCSNKQCSTARNGKARRANRICPHLRCKKCCLDLGGCEIHRSSDFQFQPITDASGGPIQAQSPNITAANASPDPHPDPCQSPPLPSSRNSSYARPLDDSYGANVYVARHVVNFQASKQIAQQRQIAEQMENTITLIIWTAAGSPPLRINVMTPYPGRVLLAEHEVFVDAMDSACAVEVYRTIPTVHWIRQTFSVPISIPFERFILLRVPGLGDGDCLNLDDEAKQLHGKHVSTNNQVKLPATQRGPAAPLPQASTSFPPVYACEVGTIMSAISNLKGKKALAEAIKVSRLQIGRTAFYQHRHYYLEALRIGIFAAAVEKGMTPEGLWSDVVRAVKVSLGEHASTQALPPTINSPSSSPPPSSSTSSFLSSPPSTPIIAEVDDNGLDSSSSSISDTSDSSEDEYDYEVMEGRIEEFRQDDDGTMTSFYPPEKDNIQFMYILKPTHVGNRKHIHYAFYIHDGQQISIALKIFNLSDEAWVPKYSSKNEGLWIEAARLYSGVYHAQRFIERAQAIRVPIDVIHVLPPYILICGGKVRLAQAWSDGVPYHKMPLSRLSEDTLSALSHYIYEMTAHREVCTAFQGLRFGKTLNIFGFKTSRDNDDDRQHRLLDNDGWYGLADFASDHLCNDICRAFALPPLAFAFAPVLPSIVDSV